MFKRILCPVDGSDHAREAERLAIDLAKNYGAKLIFLHSLLNSANSKELQRFAHIEGLEKTVEPELRRLQSLEGRLEYGYDEQPTSSRVLADVGQRILDDCKRRAEDDGVSKVDAILVNGDTAARILQCIKEREIDCVVIGSRGLSDAKGLFLGSVSHKVANEAPCTCIAVK